MSFTLSEVIHIISTIDDLLSMGEHPYTIVTSAGYDVKDNNEEVEFINFTFPLKNGIVSMKMYQITGLITYQDYSEEILESIEFNNRNVAQLNGSFKKAFKQIRKFDRQQVSTGKNSNNTSIDRASFGLAEVN